MDYEMNNNARSAFNMSVLFACLKRRSLMSEQREKGCLARRIRVGGDANFSS